MKETSRSLVRFSTLYVYVFAVSGIVIVAGAKEITPEFIGKMVYS